MRHSTDADGNENRATGDIYPLPVKMKIDVGGVAEPVSAANPLPVSGTGFTAQVTITRPENTTAYTAGDAIGTDGGILQVETATAAGTVTAEVAQVETATAVGTITVAIAQVETATAVGTITVGTEQVETATAVGTITGSGNATVIVTAALVTGSPITLNVPVLDTDTAATWAGKVRDAMNLVDAITDHYTVSGATDQIVLTALVKAANDATLNISLDNGTCTGITAAPTSANTTAGVAPGTGNATVVVTGAGIAGSPVTLAVAVVAGDTAATWAGKVRTALAANGPITALYTASGATDQIILTRTAAAANDATLNISLDNGTCTGITAAPTSANTTAGVAPGTGNATVVVTGAGITGSPITLAVAVVQGDTAATWAGKVRTALAANGPITALYTVSGATDQIILTRISKAANDATVNISLDNGTSTGITPAPTSANTTAGSLTGPNAGSAIIELANIGPAGGHIFITDVNLEIDVAAIPAGMTSFRAQLYTAAPDAIVDNAAWDLSSAGDRGKSLGYVDIATPLDLGSTLFSQNLAVNKKVKLAAGSTSLYTILRPNTGYTPTSGAVKVLTVEAVAA